MQLYPLRFLPLYQNYLWGGRRFETHLGRHLDQTASTYAESWEISDHPRLTSQVAFGPLAGTTMRQLVVRFGPALLGDRPLTRFPLLLKYLDAQERLSVQVHPDDRLASRMNLADCGKAEAWYILDAEPTARIWCGFRQPTDESSVENAVRRGSLEEHLHSFQPTAGQCLLIPPGTVHAVGGGLLIAEIQQTSDATFRLFDWNRVGPDGKSRPLHIAEALQALDYGRCRVEPRVPRATGNPAVQRLAECEKFVLDLWQIGTPHGLGGDGRFHLLTVLEGGMRLALDPAGLPLTKGQSILLPASSPELSAVPEPSGCARFLDAYLPDETRLG